MTTPIQALSALWGTAGLPPAVLAGARLDGEDPVLPSAFRLGTAAACIGAVGLAAAEIHRRRTWP